MPLIRPRLPTIGPGGGGATGNPTGGVVIGWVVANPSQNVEVLRAPDSPPGTADTANEISLAVLPPGISGYSDLSATVSLTFYHYRVRHVFPGYTAGQATQYIRVHGVEFAPGGSGNPPLPDELFSVGGAAGAATQAGAIGVSSHGTYTPTLTNGGNVAASTAFVCQFMRVGSVVTVSGQVDVDPSVAATLTTLLISLPIDIPSDFTAANQCGGTSATSAIDPIEVGSIRADFTGKRALLDFIPADGANRSLFFMFSYLVVV